MFVKLFEVANVRCEGCANSIKNALAKEGYSQVHVDLSCEPRKVAVRLQDEASAAHIEEILRKLGYPLADKKVGFTDSAALKAKSFVSCAVGKFNTTDDGDNFITK